MITVEDKNVNAHSCTMADMRLTLPVTRLPPWWSPATVRRLRSLIIIKMLVSVYICFLSLDEAIAFRVLFVIVSGSDGRKRFCEAS